MSTHVCISGGRNAILGDEMCVCFALEDTTSFPKWLSISFPTSGIEVFQYSAGSLALDTQSLFQLFYSFLVRSQCGFNFLSLLQIERFGSFPNVYWNLDIYFCKEPLEVFYPFLNETISIF